MSAHCTVPCCPRSKIAKNVLAQSRCLILESAVSQIPNHTPHPHAARHGRAQARTPHTARHGIGHTAPLLCTCNRSQSVHVHVHAHAHVCHGQVYLAGALGRAMNTREDMARWVGLCLRGDAIERDARSWWRQRAVLRAHQDTDWGAPCAKTMKSDLMHVDLGPLHFLSSTGSSVSSIRRGLVLLCAPNA